MRMCQPDDMAGVHARSAGEPLGMAQTSVQEQPAARRDGFARIADYAAIGDGHTVALVASDGAIDWLCLPAFSSPSVFAAMLDPGKGGVMRLAPAEPFEVERRYLPGTNVLESTYTTASGRARVTDSMNLGAVGLLPGSELARRVEGLSGNVRFAWSVEPRFEYGQQSARAEVHDGVPMMRHDRTYLGVIAPRADTRDDSVRGELTVAEGEREIVALVAAQDGPLMFPDPKRIDARLDDSIEGWRRWIGGCEYDGRWRDAVERSLLALKLLVYEPSGAMVAAPTTSLPECIGAERNFDYRFAWVRDTTFALDATLRIGMREQAHRTFTWLLQATAHTHPRVQPIYKLDGHPPSGQDKLDLIGYRQSQPVHSGNNASSQIQLGNYADMLETAWLYVRSGARLDEASGRRLAEVADVVCELWPAADAGIWELSDKRQYTQSKMACWVAVDRAQKLAHAGQVPGGHRDRWQRTAQEIHSFVTGRCWSDRRQSFVRDAAGEQLDAATLLAARMQFLDSDDQRMDATIDTIRRELGAGGPLLYRYTGMRDEEGAFVACSFWLAEALARVGRLDEAAETIDGMLAYTSPLGLISEEIDPESGELRGNFPQGLSHLALLNAVALYDESSG
jgi:GH15 family glucan-1,4-alpha-glucosidase